MPTAGPATAAMTGSEGSHEMKHRRVCSGGWFVQKITDVIARAENTFMTLNDQDAASAVGLRRINGFGHGGVHIASDGILFV